MTAIDTYEDIATVTKVVMRPPTSFNVIIYNDDKTTIEFVVLVLMSIFHKSFEDANNLTKLIHENGQGIAGTYNFEIATQKRDDTINAARINGFPLKCELQVV